MIARMRMTRGILITALKVLSAIFLISLLTGCESHLAGMLNPKGIVAFKERKLFFDTLALMLLVVLPVIIMSFTFVYHYQISHRTTDYEPNWSHSVFFETIWWGIPCIIILILATMTWKSTHDLDPYKRLTGHNEPPLLIEIIALPWKWLFIYPEQNIATVNYLEIPIGRQVEYWITTDNVPMSAFFVPQLGSQIYTMAGMRTRLHLSAYEAGVFEGMNTQFNGDGFSEMHFETHVVSVSEMDKWFETMKKSPNALSLEAYNQLLMPSVGDKPQFFAGVPKDLFNSVMALYMHSTGSTHPRENLRQNQPEVTSNKE